MLQTGEIIVIVLIALIVLGPTRLPGLARKVGRWTNELRTAAREITRGLEAEVADLREIGKELKAPMDEVKKPFTEIRDEVSGFGPKGREWKGPKPVSGPTPEDAMRDLEEINRLAEDGEEDDAPRADSAETPPIRPSASPPPSPDGDTSPNASLGEETDGEQTAESEE